MPKINITHLDTAMILLEIGNLRLLTDPVFDQPGKLYHFGWGTLSRKKSPVSKNPEDLGSIDAILLSHDQHGDNLDDAGRQFVLSQKNLITTKPATKRLGLGQGLDFWQSTEIEKDGQKIKITATPARHGPPLSRPVVGKVIGFVIEGEGLPTIYISGDTVYYRKIKEISQRFQIDIAILHAGGVRFWYLTGPVRYTMTSRGLIKACGDLNPKTIIPIHYGGWSHFRQGEAELRSKLANSEFANRVKWLEVGRGTQI